MTAETTPHYLTLDDTAVNGYNTLAKVNPPLRTPADVAAMREAVKTGVIDMLATDHAPHAAHEKETPFDEAPNGFTGMDLALTITYGLVREGVLTEADLIRLWATEPARVFNLPVNTFEPGAPPTSSFSILSSNGRSRPRPSTPRATIPRGSVSPSRACVSAHWIGGVKIV